VKRAAAVRRRGAQRGAAALEFALGAVIFFSFIFFVLELSRVFYLWNSLVDVTRGAARAAAYSDPSATSMLTLRNAVMRTSSGGLPLGGNLGVGNLVIDHLNGNLDPVAAPACAADNISTCAGNPEAATCVRFVRVRLCASNDAACGGVPYQPLVSTGLLPMANFKFPTFATITPVGTLGYRAGAVSTCPP
jgi:hypothetical protein